jgi:hypothetical protein
MARIVHIIDPDQDTVIVLKNPCTVFAPWVPEEEQQVPTVASVPTKKDRKKKKVRRRVERKAHL